MLASRVGNTTLDRSDTRHGRVAVVGETRWMVACMVSRETQQEDSVRRLLWETVPRRGDDGRGVLFCVAVSRERRFETESGSRADARFVRGICLGKTTESDEHLFANELEVYTTKTVKRVPDSEQKRADLVRSLQGIPWDRFAGRPDRTRQLLKQRPLRHLQWPRKPNVRVKMRMSAAV